jgi:DNA-binding MltR family transcriptional regulator
MPKRPPKPEGLPSKPRFKARGKPPNATLESLSALSRATPKQDHRGDFIQEINQEKNDRGAAILVVTNVENALQTCLQNILVNQDASHNDLFGNNAPMATFDSKIRMAYALGIVGPEMLENLNIIRHIRNAFAHSKIPITFDTKEVADASNLLHKPDLIDFAPIDDSVFASDWEISNTIRMKFITICNIMATNLARYAHHASGLRMLVRNHKTNKKLQIVVRSKPLP